MGFLELFLLAVGVSMDAFAVSICKGLAVRKVTIKECAICGGWFGGFQALMPLIGFYLGTLFAEAIQAFDHWVAFGLLIIIGINMLKEAFSKEEPEACDVDGNDLGFKNMLVMAIATSIDALSVGFTIADYTWLSALLCCLLIGGVTFVICAAGILIGRRFGTCMAGKASILGGVILIIIGIEIFITGIM